MGKKTERRTNNHNNSGLAPCDNMCGRHVSPYPKCFIDLEYSQHLTTTYTPTSRKNGFRIYVKQLTMPCIECLGMVKSECQILVPIGSPTSPHKPVGRLIFAAKLTPLRAAPGSFHVRRLHTQPNKPRWSKEIQIGYPSWWSKEIQIGYPSWTPATPLLNTQKSRPRSSHHCCLSLNTWNYIQKVEQTEQGPRAIRETSATKRSLTPSYKRSVPTSSPTLVSAWVGRGAPRAEGRHLRRPPRPPHGPGQGDDQGQRTSQVDE